MHQRVRVALVTAQAVMVEEVQLGMAEGAAVRLL
jgi:hypothetical protein